MELQRTAVAGTLESSDAQVTIMPDSNGIKLELQSSVMNQYGRQIQETVLNTLKKLDVKNCRIHIVDKGALDCTLQARVECAVFRSCGKSDKNIPWGRM
ncbi:MAG: citrate lyase acyl carrier protein [Clostridiales bacterium]|nr:MAG: citrate lyase acyl carrier protein [Clostridiales bacterium]